MAKDVDLSSQEWRDLVFEGKNKDFGAYTLRTDSPRRHTTAVVSVVIVMAIIVAVALFWAQIKLALAPEEVEDPNAGVEQIVEANVDDQVTEDIEEPEDVYIPPPPEEQIIKEEVLNTDKISNIAIVDETEKIDEIKTQDDAQNTETAAGTTFEDKGVDNIIDARQHKDEVIVEKVVEPEPEKVFETVEQDPQFPGGQAALLKYVADHIRYPAACQENGTQGRVVLQFVVTKNGTVGQVKVVKPVHPDLDAEAVRVVKTLPKFTPGKMNGHAVNVWYTLPVVFRLQGV